jgi:hypothetical protein
MQMQIHRELAPNTIDGHKSPIAAIQPGVVLSFESQLKLRAIYDYVEACQLTLNEIRVDLALDDFSPEGVLQQNDSMNLQRASEKLESFCVDADSWGFSALYEIALGLRMLLMNSGSRIKGDDFRKLLQHALSLLSALLEQCERDFYWRLAIADMLDCFEQASRD